MNTFTSTLLTRLALVLIPFLSVAGPQQATRNKDSGKKSLLWEISGNGLRQPSYIFGTIHLIGKKDFFLSDRVQKAMDRSSRLVMEMDLDPSQYQTIMNDMLMPYSLDSLLSPEDYAKVERFISDSLHLGMMFFNRMKPFFTYQTIYTSVALGKDAESYELRIAEQFREKNKPVQGLETLQYQTALFDKIPYALQARMLVQAIENTSRMKEELDSLISLYKKEDIEAMVKQSMDTSELAPYSGMLLNDRNSEWIPEIRKLIAKETVFIAVGAAHLGGEKGLLSLLRKEGYTVRPVTEKSKVRKSKGR